MLKLKTIWKRWSNCKTHNKIIIIFLTLINLLTTYVLSYGCILPLLEKNYLTRYIAYWAYCPLESIRVKSYHICYLTEKMYDECGGLTPVYERAPSGGYTRREISWHSDGRMSDEIFRGEYGKIIKMYYPNGNIEACGNDKSSRIWYSNGQLESCFEYNKKAIYYDRKGNIIGQCTIYEEYRPWNGCIVSYGQPLRNVETATKRVKKYYKNGVLIKTETMKIP